MNKKLVGIQKMAEKLDVQKSWLYSRTRTGEIPHYKVGKYVKFVELEVMEWLKTKIRPIDESGASPPKCPESRWP